MLELKLQYFSQLMRRDDSLEKTLMLEKIEGKKRRELQKIRCLDGITNMSLSKLQEIMKDREAWRTSVHGVAKSRTGISDRTTTTKTIHLLRAFQVVLKEPVCQYRRCERHRHLLQVQSLGREDPLEKDMASHSSILAWRIPMVREAWHTAVHGVAESGRTQLLNNNNKNKSCMYIYYYLLLHLFNISHPYLPHAQ